MNNDNRHRLLALLGSAQSGRVGRDGVDTGADLGLFLIGVCEVAVGEAGASGGGFTALSSPGPGGLGRLGLICATDEVSCRLENLQATLGEGPCAAAHATGRAMLDDDLSQTQARWPMFASEALAAGAAAVFCFPWRTSATGRLGTLCLHRAIPGGLDDDQQAAAEILADIAAWVVDVRLIPPAESQQDWVPDSYAPVHIAAGLLAERWQIPVPEAIVRIRAFAFARAEPLVDVARGILTNDVTPEK